MRERVQRIFKNLDREGGQRADAVVLMMGTEPHVDQSFFYATDLVRGGAFEGSIGILWPDGRVEVCTSTLEETSARKAPEAEITVYKTNDEKNEWLTRKISGLSRVGINAPEITFKDYTQVRKAASETTEIIDVSKGILHARIVKDSHELARIQKACDIVSHVAEKIPSMLKTGMTESELSAELSYHMQKLGAAGTSFSSIVSFGETSAEPHYAPADVKLGKDQFVLCDFGAVYEHYASDLTRSWVRGKGTSEMKGIYETVLRAHEAAIRAIRPGVKGADVHNAAAAIIDASPWKGRFIHSIGHSLGLAVHDGGVLHPRMDLTLDEGMVLTVEPGIYVPGLGGVRIEDDVVVTKTGCRELTKARKDYQEV